MAKHNWYQMIVSSIVSSSEFCCLEYEITKIDRVILPVNARRSVWIYYAVKHVCSMNCLEYIQQIVLFNTLMIRSQTVNDRNTNFEELCKHFFFFPFFFLQLLRPLLLCHLPLLSPFLLFWHFPQLPQLTNAKKCCSISNNFKAKKSKVGQIKKIQRWHQQNNWNYNVINNVDYAITDDNNDEKLQMIMTTKN